MHFAFAVDVGGRVSTFKQVIVDLIDSAGVRLAYLSLIRLKFGDLGRLCALGGNLDRFVWLVRLAVADTALDLIRHLQLHGVRYMAVYVNRGCG